MARWRLITLAAMSSSFWMGRRARRKRQFRTSSKLCWLLPAQCSVAAKRPARRRRARPAARRCRPGNPRHGVDRSGLLHVQPVCGRVGHLGVSRMRTAIQGPGWPAKDMSNPPTGWQARLRATPPKGAQPCRTFEFPKGCPAFAACLRSVLRPPYRYPTLPKFCCMTKARFRPPTAYSSPPMFLPGTIASIARPPMARLRRITSAATRQSSRR